MAAMTALFGIAGAALGGRAGLMIALTFSVFSNFFAYWNADKIVLSAMKAKPIDENSAQELFQITRRLAQRAQIPMPKLYLVDNPQPNAFATGRNPQNAVVAVHTGLLRLLNKDEVAAVVAHELAHIKNRDTLTMTVTATMAGAISSIANFLMFFGGRSHGSNGNNGLQALLRVLVMILAPVAAAMIQFAISRSREYEADRVGAEICGNPIWLANALRKLSGGAAKVMNETVEERREMAPMFIVNPLNAGGVDNLFATHPNIENRVAKLADMAETMQKQNNNDMPQMKETNIQEGSRKKGDDIF